MFEDADSLARYVEFLLAQLDSQLEFVRNAGQERSKVCEISIFGSRGALPAPGGGAPPRWNSLLSWLENHH